jgi:ribose/xylose/arabinose/galactoside ABC-type transport system permease subunit
LTLIRISPFWQLAAQGLLILIAVISDKWIVNRVERTNQ